MLTRCRIAGLLVAVIALTSVFANPGQTGKTEDFTEYQVKSAFLAKFPHFIDWPGKAPDAPFVICVLGRNPFGSCLDDLVRHTRFLDHPTVLRYVQNPQEALGADLVYISRSEVKRIAEIVAVFRDRPILTVGDTKGYAEQGVLINLYMSGGSVRFEINVKAVARSGLRFRSNLLRLARLVQ